MLICLLKASPASGNEEPEVRPQTWTIRFSGSKDYVVRYKAAVLSRRPHQGEDTREKGKFRTNRSVQIPRRWLGMLATITEKKRKEKGDGEVKRIDTSCKFISKKPVASCKSTCNKGENSQTVRPS